MLSEGKATADIQCPSERTAAALHSPSPQKISSGSSGGKVASGVQGLKTSPWVLMWGWDSLEGGDQAERGASSLSPVPSWAIWTSCACFSPRLNSPGKTVTKDSWTMHHKKSHGTVSILELSPGGPWEFCPQRLPGGWRYIGNGASGGMASLLDAACFILWGKSQGLWIKLSDSWGAGGLFNSSLSHSLNTAKGIWNLAHIDHIVGANGIWASPNQWVLNKAHWLLGLICRTVTLQRLGIKPASFGAWDDTQPSWAGSARTGFVFN